MLSKFKNYEEIMKKYGYYEDELINAKKINSYILKNNTIEKVEIEQSGMAIELFDEIINSLNEISEDIYFSLQEE